MKKENDDRSPRASGRIAPADIQQKEFRISRLRGYKERDVDEFLDLLTEQWSAVLSENERLRGHSGPSIGAPDLDDVSRQADEILARARQDAARIIREADDRAAALAGGTPTAGADTAMIREFLGKEREFLRSLGSLVQDHAEGVKGMAREVFASSGSPARPEASKPSAEPAPTEPAPTQPAPTQPAPGAVEAADQPASRSGADSEPVRIEEPEPVSIGVPEAPDDQAKRDRSLRELFWGEE